MLTPEERAAAERLRRLHAGENPYFVYAPNKFGKPWSVGDERQYSVDRREDLEVLAAALLTPFGNADKSLLWWNSKYLGKIDSQWIGRERCEKLSVLIVAAMNSLPSLLEENAALAERCERLEEQLSLVNMSATQRLVEWEKQQALAQKETPA